MDSVVIVGEVDNVDNSLATVFCPYMWALSQTRTYIFGVGANEFALDRVEKALIDSGQKMPKFHQSIYRER